jgi:hypothetical protein
MAAVDSTRSTCARSTSRLSCLRILALLDEHEHEHEGA